MPKIDMSNLLIGFIIIYKKSQIIAFWVSETKYFHNAFLLNGLLCTAVSLFY